MKITKKQEAVYTLEVTESDLSSIHYILECFLMRHAYFDVPTGTIHKFAIEFRGQITDVTYV